MLTASRSSLNKSVLFVGVYGVVVFLLPQLLRHVVATSNEVAWAVINMGAYCFLAVLGFVLFRETVRQAIADIRREPQRILGAVAVAMIAVLVASAVVALIRGETGTDNQREVQAMVEAAAVSMVVVAVVGPFVEELVYREILIGRASQHAPVWIMAVVSTGLFGLAHVAGSGAAGLSHVWLYLALGAILAGLYVWSGKRFAYPLVAHALNNAGALIATAVGF